MKGEMHMNNMRRLFRGGGFLCGAVLLIVVALAAKMNALGWSGAAPHEGNSSEFAEILRGVAAVSPTDAWAVGYSGVGIASGGIFPPRALIEHWDGTSWQRVPSPNPCDGISALYRVAAVSSNDVWAVGGECQDASFGGSLSQTLAEHWDGTQWSVVATPHPNPISILASVAVISSSDVWAVGYAGHDPTTVQALAEHWDGTKWSVVFTPSPEVQQVYFNSVVALATDNVWALGTWLAPKSAVGDPFIEHWNGTEWSIAFSPNTIPGGFNSDAAASSPDLILSVGSAFSTLEWDGMAWNQVKSPGFTISYMDGVAAFPGGEAWAAGYFLPISGEFAPLLERWDGTEWRQVTIEGVPGTYDFFGGIHGTSTTDIWAVGAQAASSVTPDRTLIAHWDGTAWSVVPSP